MKTLFAVLLTSGLVAAMPQSRGGSSAPSTSGPMLTNQAAFDGRRLFLAGWDVPTASLWDVETGLRVREFVGHTEGVRSVALSPDGRQLVTGAGSTSNVSLSKDNSIRIWDADSGRELRRFDLMTYPALRAPVLEVAFSDTAREVIGVGPGLVIWDVNSGRRLFHEASYSNRRQDSLRAGLVITRGGPGNFVRTWDYRSGKMLAEIELTSIVSSSQWSPDGRAVVVAAGPDVSTWNALTGQLERTYVGHTSQVSDAMFSGDGQRVISASADRSVRIWDRISGKQLGQLTHEGAVRRALISPDGRRMLTQWQVPRDTNGPYTSLWDVDSARLLVSFDQLRKPLGFSPDGRTIPVVDGPSLGGICCRLDSLLDATTGQPIRRFQP